MGVQEREIRLRSRYTLRKDRDTLYIAIDADYFEELGIDPADNRDELPDKLTTEFVKQGRNEGVMEIDLKSQVEEATNGD